MRYSISSLLITIVNAIFGLALIALVLRFFLRLFGANPSAGFTDFIYSSTSPLLDPFRGIFRPVEVVAGGYLEFSTLFAIVIYLLLAWLITEFISYLDYYSGTTYRNR